MSHHIFLLLLFTAATIILPVVTQIFPNYWPFKLNARPQLPWLLERPLLTSDSQPQNTLPFILGYLNIPAYFQQSTSYSTWTSTFTVICTIPVSRNCSRARRDDEDFNSDGPMRINSDIAPSPLLRLVFFLLSNRRFLLRIN